MKNIIVVIIMAVISIGSISCNKKAESEPYSFKEFQLGMTLADFDNLSPLVKNREDVDKFTAIRTMDTTIGGCVGTASFIFEDYGAGLQLGTILIHISATDFPRVKAALASQYGQPIKLDAVMDSLTGGEYFEWKNKTSTTITAGIPYNAKMAAIFFNHNGLGRSIKDRAARAKERAGKDRKDL